VPDFALAAQIDELTRRIAREYGKPAHAIDAKIAAEAEMTILKIRTIRAELLDKGEQDLPKAIDRARASVGPPTVQNAYLKAIPRLLTLDQYEQRAISRRRHALRQLREPIALR
jgi:hypothetical protein